MVSVQKVNPPLKSGVVLANVVDASQGLMFHEKLEGNRKYITSETLNRTYDRASLEFKDGTIAFIPQRDLAEECDEGIVLSRYS